MLPALAPARRRAAEPLVRLVGPAEHEQREPGAVGRVADPHELLGIEPRLAVLDPRPLPVEQRLPVHARVLHVGLAAANLLGSGHEADRARSGGDRRGLRLRLGAGVDRLALLPGPEGGPVLAQPELHVDRQGRLGQAVHGRRAEGQQPIDCFYVYPSVSTENRGNSDLKPGIEETDTARLQASWFSPICRVFAPMYRQVTTHGDGNPLPRQLLAGVRRRARARGATTSRTRTTAAASS